MKNQKSSYITFAIIFLVFTIISINVSATCKPSGYVRGRKTPPDTCHELDCCSVNKVYPIYKCSPPVSTHTKATLRITSFEIGVPMCDNKYHNDNMMVVSISTGWFNKGERCARNIIIHGNGRNVSALVIDETDSAMGCDVDHDYQPPSPYNVVDASKAVWKALDVPLSEWGELDITWSDAN